MTTNLSRDKKQYVVALPVSSEMGSESSGTTYHDKQIIEAYDEVEAVEIYNEKNNCSYYYGKVLGEVINGEVTVKIKVDDFMRNN